MSNHDCELPTSNASGATFDEVVLPHLDAGCRLARWLTGNDHDAEDVVQEAALRAFRYFRTFSGGNGRAWFLTIVRNTCFRWRSRSLVAGSDPFDEEQHTGPGLVADPEALLLHADDVGLIERAMSRLPDRLHALLVLRELEELSYQKVAEVMGVPIGTVMSGLSRARQALRRQLTAEMKRCGIAQRDSASRLQTASRVNRWNRRTARRVTV